MSDLTNHGLPSPDPAPSPSPDVKEKVTVETVPAEVAEDTPTQFFRKASNGRAAVSIYVSLAILAAAVPALAEMTMDRWHGLSPFQQSAFFLGIALSALNTLKAATSSSTRPKG